MNADGAVDEVTLPAKTRYCTGEHEPDAGFEIVL